MVSPRTLVVTPRLATPFAAAQLLNKHAVEYDQNGAAGAEHPDGYGSVFTNTHVFEASAPPGHHTPLVR